VQQIAVLQVKFTAGQLLVSLVRVCS